MNATVEAAFGQLYVNDGADSSDLQISPDLDRQPPSLGSMVSTMVSITAVLPMPQLHSS